MSSSGFRLTVRKRGEIESRLRSLDSNAPNEEEQVLRWFLKEPGINYPEWRHEVRKVVDVDVVVYPSRIEPRAIRLPEQVSGKIDLEAILNFENPTSPEVLGRLKPPPGHRPIPTLAELKASFEKNLYFMSDDDIFTVYQTLLSGRALQVSGPPGSGKTELAKQIAIALGLDLDDPHHYNDLFCTPDISVNEAMYRWNDAKRLQEMQLFSSALTSLRDRIDSEQITAMYQRFSQEAYSSKYLDIMPLLRAVLIPFRTVRLLDEVDKTYPTFDNILLDLISKFAYEVPEYGTIGKPSKLGDKTKPVFVIVSNGTRDLSSMVMSRCVTLWLNYLPENLEAKIIGAKTELDYQSSQMVASFFRRIRQMSNQKNDGLRLRHPPSTREVIATAEALPKNGLQASVKSLFKLNSYWVKNPLDYESVKSKFFDKTDNVWKNELV